MDHVSELTRVSGGWSWSEIIAFGMLVVAVLGMMAGGIVAIARFSHTMGKHDQRLITAEREIKELKMADRSGDNDRADLRTLTAVVTRLEAGVATLSSTLGRRIDDLERDIRHWLADRKEG